MQNKLTRLFSFSFLFRMRLATCATSGPSLKEAVREKMRPPSG